MSGYWHEDVYVEQSIEDMRADYDDMLASQIGDGDWEPVTGTCVHCGGDICQSDDDGLWYHYEGDWRNTLDPLDHLARPEPEEPCCALYKVLYAEDHEYDCPKAVAKRVRK